MQPNANITAAQFHEWYNNEHGPTRLRLPFIEHGVRYRALDVDSSEKDKYKWLAMYDITDMNELTKETYTRLRTDAVKSEREKRVMKEISINRKLFDLITEKRSPEVESVDGSDDYPEGNILVAITTSSVEGKEDEQKEWLLKEHDELVAKVPGWRRSRLYVTSPLLEGMRIEYLELHEFAPGSEDASARFYGTFSTKVEQITSEDPQTTALRWFKHYYTFGPAPRDLTSLSDTTATNYSSRDGSTKTIIASKTESAAIESYVTAKDGVPLIYRLEGSSNPNAPIVVLSNSVLVEWGIWDDFVDAFLSVSQNLKYRVLRYHTRGRTANTGSEPITIDTLSGDIIAIMDALRVPKAAALIGVSLGGVTVLNTALKYPDRIQSFISCDTSAKSPDGNKKTWAERISVAENQNATNHNGEKVVGDELAEMTVRRWFVKESYDGGNLEHKISRVKSMVKSNSLEGFKKGVEALFAYDIVDEMKSSKTPGAFVVGNGDGVLPETMKTMAQQYGGGLGRYKSIESAGHLPMVEKPHEFAQVVTEFLQSP